MTGTTGRLLVAFLGVALSLAGPGCDDDSAAGNDNGDAGTNDNINSQGDVIRIFNHVRCVRGGAVTLDVTGTATQCPTGSGTTTTGPTSCTVQADCEAADACPPDATLGCTCEAVPEGSLCIPNCGIDADCPAPPDMTLVCGPNGLCQPE